MQKQPNNSVKSNTTQLSATPLGLYPTLDTLQSVVDLGLSQLPVMTPNALMGLLMTYHNTMLHVQQQGQKD